MPQAVYEVLRRLLGESLNRDECRTPMQWDESRTAGFCPPAANPWLPVGPSLASRNVAAQAGDPDSLLCCYRRFLEARGKTPALHAGDLELLDDSGWPDCLLVYRRRASAEGREQEARVYLNCGKRTLRVPAPPEGFGFLVGTAARRTSSAGPTLQLAPWEGVVFLAGQLRT